VHPLLLWDGSGESEPGSPSKKREDSEEAEAQVDIRDAAEGTSRLESDSDVGAD